MTMVHDGGAALAEFDKLHPDLVLLDVMMPVMDGWEVCRKLRAKDNTPIIMPVSYTHLDVYKRQHII